MITRPINPAHTPLLRAARAAVRALTLAACVTLPMSAYAQNQGQPMQPAPAQWEPTTGPMDAPVNAQPTPSSMPMTETGTAGTPTTDRPHRWSSHPREPVYNPPCNGPASFCNVYFGN